MVNLGVIIAFLAAFSRKENLSHALPTQYIDKFTVVVKRTIVKDSLYEQSITDLMFSVLGNVPEQIAVFIYDLLT